MPTPAQILGLAGQWKLTLPEGPAEHPTELAGGALAAYQGGPWLYQRDDGVAFRAPVNGVTTSGSGYPRCELREMTTAGQVAAWSSSQGAHVLDVDMAFTCLPSGKPHVVGAQIHGSSDDVTVLRLEGTKLYVTKGDDSHYKLIDSNYALGTRMRIQCAVWRDQVLWFRDGAQVAAVSAQGSGWFYKAGAYVQANCTNASPCTSDNAGEVTLYAVAVAHTDQPGPAPSPTPAPAPSPAPTPEPLPASGWPRDPNQPKRVVIVMRHGEKPADKTSHVLSPTGEERARRLAALFAQERLPAGLWHPDRVIASKGTTASMRPVQTVQPLVDVTGLPLNTRYDFEVDYATSGPWLAQRLDVTLVCAEHSAIPALVKTFGTIKPKPPKKWPDDRYDVFLVLTSSDGKTWALTQVPQMLMPGDTAKPIK